MDVLVTAQTVSHALSAGFDVRVMKERLSLLAAVPDPVGRVLAQASAVLGRAEYVACSGFLWVDDPEVRELLLNQRQSADLFIDPSPPGGLLIAPGVDAERLARRCRAAGVELVVGGQIYRTRSTAPPSRRSSSHRLDSNLLKSVTSPKEAEPARRSRPSQPPPSRR